MRTLGTIAALILAAGQSSRMGFPKPFLQVGNSSALEKAVSCFHLAGIEDVRVVVGHRADEVVPFVNRLNAKWVLNESYQEGMLSSILTGIRSLGPGIEAFFLLPVDVPLVKPQTVLECLRTYRESGARVVYPTFRGLQGHPPLIEKSCVAELTAGFEGGLRAFLERYRLQAAYVTVVDQGVVMECNTPEEYRNLLAYGLREDIPTERECEAIRDRFRVSEAVAAHCLKVAEVAGTLAAHLNCAGLNLDIDLIGAAALLHDIARGQPDHARQGARMLAELGHERVARIVASHMDIHFEDRSLDESHLVYLADKCVRGSRLVRIEERFDSSFKRFADDLDALNAALKRFSTALAIRERFESIVGISLEDAIGKHGGSVATVVSGQRAIYLVRHGAVESLGAGKHYIGQLDLPLSEEGIRQAEAMNEGLRNVSISGVFCSDLSRSFKMAEIIAAPHGIMPVPREDLREIAMGEWEGLSFDEVRLQSPDAYLERGRDIVYYRSPGGESFFDCARRVIPAMFDILRSSRGNIVIVGHAGVNRLLLCQIMGKSIDALFDIKQSYSCLNLIRYKDFALEVEVLNETAPSEPKTSGLAW